MATKTAVVRQIKGITLAAKADSNHWILMDGQEKFGGSDAAASPKELLLMSLGGCTAMDIIPIMTKKRVPFTNVEVRLTATVSEEHPQVFTSINIEYVIYGNNVDLADVERAVELSRTKYCSVSAMLSTAMTISHSIRIEPPAS